jgi:hypothetical protein
MTNITSGRTLKGFILKLQLPLQCQGKSNALFQQGNFRNTCKTGAVSGSDFRYWSFAGVHRGRSPVRLTCAAGFVSFLLTAL